MSEVAKYGFTAREMILMREAYIGGTGDACSGGLKEWLSDVHFGLAEHERVLTLAEKYPVSLVVSEEDSDKMLDAIDEAFDPRIGVPVVSHKGVGKVPNAETVEAMRELEEGKCESFTLGELFEDLGLVTAEDILGNILRDW